jgi:hypothetical protein
MWSGRRKIGASKFLLSSGGYSPPPGAHVSQRATVAGIKQELTHVQRRALPGGALHASVKNWDAPRNIQSTFSSLTTSNWFILLRIALKAESAKSGSIEQNAKLIGLLYRFENAAKVNAENVPN